MAKKKKLQRWKGRPYNWPGTLTEGQQDLLQFLVEHGPASTDLLGEAADKFNRPRTDGGPICPGPLYALPGRVGAATLIWLREWGFVAPYRYEEHDFWTITERGSAALALVKGGST